MAIEKKAVDQGLVNFSQQFSLILRRRHSFDMISAYQQNKMKQKLGKEIVKTVTVRINLEKFFVENDEVH